VAKVVVKDGIDDAPLILSLLEEIEERREW